MSESPPGTALHQDLQALLDRIVEAATHADKAGLVAWFDRTKHLSGVEQELLLKILTDIRDRGASPSLDAIWQLDYERKPVTIEQFLEDPYYMGETGRSLYPIWKEELLYVCDPASPVLSWIVTGSIGAGKSWATLLGELYKGPYYCSCLRNPQTYYGLAPGSTIVFGLFNITLANARSIDFNQFLRFIDSCKYFKENCLRAKGTNPIYFPTKLLAVIEGSASSHALGANLFSYHIDEVNEMKVPQNLPKGVDEKERSQAYKLYNATRLRMLSRFQAYGHCPGLACLVSSRKTQSSFLEELMRDEKNNPTVHVSDYALWDTKGREKYSAKTFRVAIGNRYRGSRILDELNEKTKEIENSHPLPDGQSAIEVPIDFYSDFRRNPDEALRDIAGIPTFGLNPLIHRVEAVRECVDWTRQHPFICDEAILPLDDPNSDLLKLVQWEKLIYVDQSMNRLKLRPQEPRVAHVDIGLTGDCAGFAIGHRYSYYTITHYDPTTGQAYDEFRPKVWIDMMLRIRPTLGTRIDITKIVAFLLNLRNFGIPLIKITFDGYQSEMAIQILQKAGQFPRGGANDQQHDPFAALGGFRGAGVQSVDKDDQAYTLLRDSMTYHGINYYHYKPFLDEVVNLEHDTTKVKGKVDHPARNPDGTPGSKDVADGVAGCVYGLLTLDLPIPTLDPETLKKQHEGDLRQDIDEQMLEAIAGDAIRSENIQGIDPPPIAPPPVTAQGARAPQRHIGTGLGNDMDIITRIARYGR